MLRTGRSKQSTLKSSNSLSISRRGNRTVKKNAIKTVQQMRESHAPQTTISIQNHSPPLTPACDSTITARRELSHEVSPTPNKINTIDSSGDRERTSSPLQSTQTPKPQKNLYFLALQVPTKHHNIRLDQFIHHAFPTLTTKALGKMVKKKEVQLLSSKSHPPFTIVRPSSVSEAFASLGERGSIVQPNLPRSVVQSEVSVSPIESQTDIPSFILPATSRPSNLIVTTESSRVLARDWVVLPQWLCHLCGDLQIQAFHKISSSPEQSIDSNDRITHHSDALERDGEDGDGVTSSSPAVHRENEQNEQNDQISKKDQRSQPISNQAQSYQDHDEVYGIPLRLHTAEQQQIISILRTMKNPLPIPSSFTELDVILKTLQNDPSDQNDQNGPRYQDHSKDLSSSSSSQDDHLQERKQPMHSTAATAHSWESRLLGSPYVTSAFLSSISSLPSLSPSTPSPSPSPNSSQPQPQPHSHSHSHSQSSYQKIPRGQNLKGVQQLLTDAKKIQKMCIYSDPYLLCINKPSGISVHASDFKVNGNRQKKSGDSHGDGEDFEAWEGPSKNHNILPPGSEHHIDSLLDSVHQLSQHYNTFMGLARQIQNIAMGSGELILGQQNNQDDRNLQNVRFPSIPYSLSEIQSLSRIANEAHQYYSQLGGASQDKPQTDQQQRSLPHQHHPPQFPPLISILSADPPRLIHRLDKATSGTLTIAKSRLVAKTLSKMFHALSASTHDQKRTGGEEKGIKTTSKFSFENGPENDTTDKLLKKVYLALTLTHPLTATELLWSQQQDLKPESSIKTPNPPSKPSSIHSSSSMNSFTPIASTSSISSSNQILLNQSQLTFLNLFGSNATTSSPSPTEGMNPTLNATGLVNSFSANNGLEKAVRRRNGLNIASFANAANPFQHPTLSSLGMVNPAAGPHVLHGDQKMTMVITTSEEGKREKVRGLPSGNDSQPFPKKCENVHIFQNVDHFDPNGPHADNIISFPTSPFIHLSTTQQRLNPYQRKKPATSLQGSSPVGAFSGPIDLTALSSNLPPSNSISNSNSKAESFQSPKNSTSLFKILYRSPLVSLVAFSPISGHFHQLRIQSASKYGLQSPIIGEDKYFLETVLDTQHVKSRGDKSVISGNDFLPSHLLGAIDDVNVRDQGNLKGKGMRQGVGAGAIKSHLARITPPTSSPPRSLPNLTLFDYYSTVLSCIETDRGLYHNNAINTSKLFLVSHSLSFPHPVIISHQNQHFQEACMPTDETEHSLAQFWLNNCAMEWFPRVTYSQPSQEGGAQLHTNHDSEQMNHNFEQNDQARSYQINTTSQENAQTSQQQTNEEGVKHKALHSDPSPSSIPMLTVTCDLPPWFSAGLAAIGIKVM